MVTPVNNVIAGPDLHRAGPLALWGFLLDLSAKCRRSPKKVLRLERGAQIPWLVLSHIMVNPALVNALHS